MPAISVIVPVYKVEKYLHRCVDSILSQTLTDFEVILVDDGSPDTCGAICDEYSASDSRVRVYHKENGGLSSARNCGLDHAQGKYILFCDSDDYIAPNTLADTYTLIQKYDADIVEFGFRFVENNGEIGDFTPSLPTQCIAGIDLLPRIYQSTYGGSIYAWNKLYSAQLFHTIRFEENRIFEDTIIMPQLFYAAKRVVILSKSYYSYCMEAGSIFRSPFSLKKLDSLYAFESNRTFFLSHGLTSVVEYLDATYAFIFIKMLKQIKASCGKKCPAYINTKADFSKKLSSFLKTPHLNLRQKLMLIFYNTTL